MKRILLTILFSILAVAGVSVLSFAGFQARAEQSQPNLWFGLGSDKTLIRPGEEFQYTIQIENKESMRVFQNVIAQALISDKLEYISGSTQQEKNGQSLSVIDNWLNTGVNLGSLNPGQKAWVRFKVRVKSDVAVGVGIKSAAQVSATNVPASAVEFTVNTVSSQETAHFVGGNFLKVINVTTGDGTWQPQEVTADRGNVIEYLVTITNDSEYNARNVKFQAFLPGPDKKGLELRPYVTVSSDNADSITDDVVVKLSQPSYLLSYPDHGRKFGETGLYDCTENDAQGGCKIPNQYYSSPMNLGTVYPGVSKTIKVIFKSGVVNLTDTTPTPTPTPSPSPTPTPQPSCNKVCNVDSDCDGGFICKSHDNTKTCRLKTNPDNDKCDNVGGFFVRKYHDENGNGSQDKDEKGLSWKFEWDKNGDGNWQAYETFADHLGEGGVVTLPDGTQVRIREKAENGWTATTATEVTLRIKAGENQLMVFGNWKGKPQVLGTTTVKQLPKSGAELELGVIASLAMISAGLYLKRLTG